MEILTMHRSDTVYKKLMDQTVLAEFFNPVLQSFEKVRYSDNRFLSLPMKAFCLFGCLRHLNGVAAMREQVQQFFHMAECTDMPVPRSTYSDALSSASRCIILQDLLKPLIDIARKQLPDRFEKISELGDRPIFAVDGSYQKESTHYQRLTPKEGGDDNHKGHMMLTLFDVRMGVPIDVAIETKNTHETLVLKNNFNSPEGCLRKRNAIFVVDRAFVNMPFWDAQKKTYAQTSITRWKDNLIVKSSVARTVNLCAMNEGVVSDDSVSLNASAEEWRCIRYKTPEGKELVFLSNELTIEPGLIAFLYLRRWDEEKCFDTWKNDFSCKKAWSKSNNGIFQQALLAVMTSLLVQLFSNHHKNALGIEDEASLKKQDDLQNKNAREKGHRIPWYRDFFRSASKVTRQILRFLRSCLMKTPSKSLYERQLRPLYLKYI
ncbi:MAG: transposase [Marinagarivorans sp.]|nr:transposase [Marinagarivorans sp.]